MKKKVQCIVVNYPHKPWPKESIIEAIRYVEKKTDTEIMLHESVVEEKWKMIEVVKEALYRNSEGILIYVPTFVWANRFLQALRNIPVPIAIWSEELTDNVPLVGLTVLHGSLEQVGIRHKLIYGKVTEEETICELNNFFTLCHVVKKLSESKFALFGGRSMGINPGMIDPILWMKLFGIDVKNVEQQAIVRAAEKVSYDKVEEIYKVLKQRFIRIVPLDKRFEKSIRLYLGYKQVIKENEIDFAAVKCIFDLSDYYASACLAQSLLNEEGFVSACCGEGNAALTMYIFSLICCSPMMMADIAFIDKEESIICLMCDGAANPSVAGSDQDVELNYQNEVESKAGGICTTLLGRPGMVTIAKFGQKDGRYILNLVEGEAFLPEEDKRRECGYPEWPQLFARLSGDAMTFLKNNVGQYTVCCYGKHSRILKEIAEYYGIEVFEA